MCATEERPVVDDETEIENEAEMLEDASDSSSPYEKMSSTIAEALEDADWYEVVLEELISFLLNDDRCSGICYW